MIFPRNSSSYNDFQAEIDSIPIALRVRRTPLRLPSDGFIESAQQHPAYAHSFSKRASDKTLASSALSRLIVGGFVDLRSHLFRSKECNVVELPTEDRQECLFKRNLVMAPPSGIGKTEVRSYPIGSLLGAFDVR